jgi:hypothetical protein
MLMVAMLALSGAAFAQSGGEGNNTGCNGQGNPNSPCVPGDTGGGGDPRDGGNGNGGNVQGQLQGQLQLQAQGQLQSQTAVATASAVNTNTNSASVGDVTATGGNASATGGSAVAAATVEAGAVSVAEGAVQSNLNYTYTERLQAPSIGQGSFAIAGCSVAGNAGGSGPGWSGFLGFGFTPSQCYDFMLAQAYQSIGEKKAVCDILKNSKAGKRQEKRGITLPECTPEVLAVPVPVPVPVDLTPYATKEELNRAFKASQSK